jgi:exopolyphosphatase / guanosine-5'-triphosphate,3'-diphosphate pyrophosphatase
MQKISIIDIWTLSIKHYIFSVEGTTKTTEYYKRYSEAYLGNDAVTAIEPEAIERNISILKQCIQHNIDMHINKTILVGTQILRTASNASDFLRQVKDMFGLEVKIITHEDEARYLYAWFIPLIHDVFAAVNVWWWSTEIVIGDKEKLLSENRIAVGVKGLKNKFYEESTGITDWSAMEDFLDEYIKKPEYTINELFITGVLDLYLTIAQPLGFTFTESNVPNHPIVFDLQTMRAFVETLRNTPVEELRKLYPQDPNFVDHVAIGQTLYRKVAQRLWVKHIYPSRNDLTDGLVAEII